MHKDNFEERELISIIINQYNRIEYSNIDEKMAYSYLKKLNLLKCLPMYVSVEYTLNEYSVTIDKFNINNRYHFIIVISAQNYKCINCHKALIDTTTGLYSRNYWEQIIEGTEYHNELKSFFLILIDIDNLKIINDDYGHLKGDRAIEIVGQAIIKCKREEDIGIRYGGDEFIILLFNQKQKAMDKVIGRIRKELNERSIDEKMDIQISTGVAYTDCLNDLKSMIKIADKKMYEEKEKKKLHKQLKINKLKLLEQEIEKLRDELNIKVIESGQGISNQGTLELSQKLDDLIANYLKNV